MPKTTATAYRTHTCGELRQIDINKDIMLSGWVHARRNHGNLIFIDLRDKYGLTQIVFDPKISKDAHSIGEQTRPEWCLKISGKVRARGQLENANLETGQIEIEVHECDVLNKSKTPPFEINQDTELNEEVRYRYRYLDIRRNKTLKYLQFRSDVLGFIRNWYNENGFLEVTTPLLTVSSPEGARDFLVPTHLHPGKFYALPQAPQQYKQLLMVAGIDKYFQIAPCLRDENPRADRVAEHYQFDTEVSFMTQDEFLSLMEPLFVELTKKFSGNRKCGSIPFPRISYKESVLRWASDKPDLRYALEIVDITDLAHKSGFGIFEKAQTVRALRIPKVYGEIARRDLDKMGDLAKQAGAGGLAWLKVKEDVGSVIKNVNTEFLSKLDEMTKNVPDAKPGIPTDKGKFADGDLVFFGAGEKNIVAKALNVVRREIARQLKLIDESLVAWAWITDFPFFGISEITNKLDFEHNPFSMPQGGMKALKTEEPTEILAYQYDLIANGFEISSGGVRNHEPETLLEAFKMVGYSEADVRKKFGHMLEAFEYGAPPHCGFAPGVERTLTVLSGEENIREFIAFPKTSNEEDLMMKAPSVIDSKQLEDVGVKVIK
ncbi:MAG: aspartate--tRNA ligase [Patescibacteria group bacterium]|nr:aspartate--tRNA ligase [Patescibacteria group bacterium]